MAMNNHEFQFPGYRFKNPFHAADSKSRLTSNNCKEPRGQYGLISSATARKSLTSAIVVRQDIKAKRRGTDLTLPFFLIVVWIPKS